MALAELSGAAWGEKAVVTHKNLLLKSTSVVCVSAFISFSLYNFQCGNEKGTQCTFLLFKCTIKKRKIVVVVDFFGI